MSSHNNNNFKRRDAEYRNEQQFRRKKQKTMTEELLEKNDEITYLRMELGKTTQDLWTKNNELLSAREQLRKIKEDALARSVDYEKNVKQQYDSLNLVVRGRDIVINHLMLKNDKMRDEFNTSLSWKVEELEKNRITIENLIQENEKIKLNTDAILRRKDKKLKENDQEISDLNKLLEDNTSKDTLNEIMKILKPRSLIEYDKAENEALIEELRKRMKCDICLEGAHSRCCPECRKGLCESCYGRMKNSHEFATCPHCRSISDEWPYVTIPRL